MLDPLLVDLYPGDLDGHADIDHLAKAGYPWCGVWFKASEGTYYTSGDWFKTNWARAQTPDNYGDTWWRGAYHYFRVDEDAVAQADLFLQTIEDAGGWGGGDIRPVVDVESAENPQKPGAAMIEDRVSKFAERVTGVYGAAPILYGNIYLAESGVTSHMGCDYLIVARYTADLPAVTYTRIGWTLEDLLGWQYAGDGQAQIHGYPHISPIGPVDITALTIAGGGQKALTFLMDNM